jgi:hypothetical protein
MNLKLPKLPTAQGGYIPKTRVKRPINIKSLMRQKLATKFTGIKSMPSLVKIKKLSSLPTI